MIGYPDRCWLTPHATVRRSPIQGSGLYATAAINTGDVVERLGGPVIDDATLAGLTPPYSSLTSPPADTCCSTRPIRGCRNCAAPTATTGARPCWTGSTPTDGAAPAGEGRRTGVRLRHACRPASPGASDPAPSRHASPVYWSAR
ncbi:MAG TPA: hypothetical protein VGG05_21625 [Pseudonocardiaceae bacterium]